MVLLSAQSQAPGFQAALSELYKIYWYPLYAYVRRRGHAPEESQDLTQGVFPAFARAQDAGTRGSAEGQVSVVFARVVAKLSFDRGRAGSLPETRRRSGVHPSGFTECGEPIPARTD